MANSHNGEELPNTEKSWVIEEICFWGEPLGDPGSTAEYRGSCRGDRKRCPTRERRARRIRVSVENTSGCSVCLSADGSWATLGEDKLILTKRGAIRVPHREDAGAQN